MEEERDKNREENKKEENETENLESIPVAEPKKITARYLSMSSVRAIIRQPTPRTPMQSFREKIDDQFEGEGLQFQLEANLFAKGFLLGLAPSMVDIVSDVFSFKHFIQGDHYLKIAHNINEFKDENCSLVSETTVKTYGL